MSRNSTKTGFHEEQNTLERDTSTSKSHRFKGYRPCRRPLSNLAQTRPKQQPPGDRLKTSKHHLNPDANPAKNPPPQRAEVTSLKPLKEKKQAPGSSTWTQNATQPSPDTPKTATSRRSTQNIQTPPKSGRKPSKKPSPAACRSDKSETHKGQETGSRHAATRFFAGFASGNAMQLGCVAFCVHVLEPVSCHFGTLRGRVFCWVCVRI